MSDAHDATDEVEVELETPQGLLQTNYTRSSSTAEPPSTPPSHSLAQRRVAAGYVALAVIVLLPHRQPFEPTVPMQLTLYAWAWSPLLAPGCVLLAAWLVRKGGRGRAYHRSPPVATLLGATAFVSSAFLYLLTLGEHSTPGHLGFLSMCVAWCGGDPFDDCYRAPSPPRPTPASAADARAFFKSSVFGATPPMRARSRANGTLIELAVAAAPEFGRSAEDVVAGGAWAAARRLTLPIVAPGRSTLLITSRGPSSVAEHVAEQTGWSVLLMPDLFFSYPWRHATAGAIATAAAAYNAAAAAALRGDTADGDADADADGHGDGHDDDDGRGDDDGDGRGDGAAGAGHRYERVAVHGCSVHGKAAFWAAATFGADYGGAHAYADAFIDSGGAAGPASLKTVGPCGETFAAMLGRWRAWLAPNASRLPPPAQWPFDVEDLLGGKSGGDGGGRNGGGSADGAGGRKSGGGGGGGGGGGKSSGGGGSGGGVCDATTFHFASGRANEWNNWLGTARTAETARATNGCGDGRVRLYEGHIAHCGYFFEGTRAWNGEGQRWSSGAVWRGGVRGWR